MSKEQLHIAYVTVLRAQVKWCLEGKHYSHLQAYSDSSSYTELDSYQKGLLI